MQLQSAGNGTVPWLSRQLDSLCGLGVGAVVFAGYLLTLAPNLTLQDAGELAVASAYLGVPHPPGYPVWTLYSWLFTVLVPFSNIAWRVALSSAVAGAAACGLVAAMVCRMSESLLEAVAHEREMGGQSRNHRVLRCVAGFVAGTLLGFNGFFWSQAVIVEVYTLSVLSLAGVLVLLQRWTLAPERNRPLIIAFFLFGICFTNHQTLLVAAMGVEVLVFLVRPAVGRDLLIGNVIVYVAGLALKTGGGLTFMTQNAPLYALFNWVGLVSAGAAFWACRKTKSFLSEWRIVLGLGVAWLTGASFYLLLPILSATNPPMNWGYPRTWEGFVHAVTRGQYSGAAPTQNMGRFVEQLWGYSESVLTEFGAASLLIGLVPWVCWRKWRERDRAWLGGMVSIFACLAFILLFLLNPPPGRQSLELNKVFFTASHVFIAVFIGAGVAAGGGLLLGDYARHRPRALYGSAVAAGLAIYEVAQLESHYPIALAAVWSGVGLATAGIVCFAIPRPRVPLPGVAVLLSLLPVQSVLSHWSDNEQRGHLFGYWYGHDMFSPPFGLYPELAKGAVLFGGTDPGRFNPTYMIFCESFQHASAKPLDPQFDRRDVYLITQNALADGTYLNYIRAHYNRGLQKDEPFFEGLFAGETGVPPTGLRRALAAAFAPVDGLIQGVGGFVERHRRSRGLYPLEEIHVPTTQDLKQTVDSYVAEMHQRMQRGEFGEMRDLNQIVNRPGGVMEINGRLAKLIFDRNPAQTFYIEESYPIAWMYPHLEPHGIIMKLNREPAGVLAEEVLARDRQFWTRYAERLCGAFVAPDSKVEDLVESARRVYLLRDFKGFNGSRTFVRDVNAQKSFSGLRNSIAGLYYWHYMNTRDSAVKDRLRREAEFAYAQAWSFCPYNAQALLRYAELLVARNEIAGALKLAELSMEFDPAEPVFQALHAQLEQMKSRTPGSGSP